MIGGKILPIVIFSILLATAVSAGNFETNSFFDQSGNQVTNVQMLVFTCLDTNDQCAVVDVPAWQNANSFSSNVIANVEFPGASTPTLMTIGSFA